MKYYPYENFKNDTKRLIDKTREFNPHAIVAIARGGLTLAHAMAEGLGIREVQTLRTELYDKANKRDCLTIFGECSFDDLKRILVVDDISDSGKTLKEVMKFLAGGNNSVEFKSATLFYKKTSIYEPHFWVNEADDWIDFFWESDFS